VSEETAPASNGSSALPAVVQTTDVRPVEPIGSAIERPLAAQLVAPVVAAAGGMLLGMATLVLVRLLRRREPARLTRRRLGRRRGEDIVASRSFKVDVHLLRR
jgi:hypothetical protein